MADHGLQTLSQRLCPWLGEPLQLLESALAEARLGHAWLIAGSPGVGKLNLALVFADRLLRGTTGGPLPPALDSGDAVEAMRVRHPAGDHHPDLHWLYPEDDKKSISVDQIRATIEALALKGFKGGAKVVVLDPAEAMTGAAANALLKCLEEASSGTYLLLVSHQPGRLPSTIRSRCQTLAVRGPAAASDPKPGAIASSRAERAPLLTAQRVEHGYELFINGLDDSLKLITELKKDPQVVADEWRKGDLAASLDWLIGRIQGAIRARVLARGSNPVTEQPACLLHNGYELLTLTALFERLDSAEKLRDQLGRGINAELALSVLLLSFQPERGRT